MSTKGTTKANGHSNGAANGKHENGKYGSHASNGKHQNGKVAAAAGEGKVAHGEATAASGVVLGEPMVGGGGKGVMPGPDGRAIEVPELQEIQAVIKEWIGGDANTSLYYVARSVVLCSVLLALFIAARSSALYDQSPIARFVIISVYWFLQGTLFWGIFVLGHDCGHGSFSNNSRLNWFVGNALHTFILVPYESWRVTHRHHHKNTGHIDNDEIFFPLRENTFHLRIKLAPYVLGIAWFYYIVRGHYPRNVHHLNPNDKLFIHYGAQGRVSASIATMLVWLLVLYSFYVKWGLNAVGHAYFGPLFVFGSWLVVTTFLHHAEENIPWFADGTWDYVKGNLSSVDRSYWPFDDLVHNIGTHQVHHLFPLIPHYKLLPATQAFRAKFPQIVRKSDANPISAFLKSMRLYTRQSKITKTMNYWTFGH